MPEGSEPPPGPRPKTQVRSRRKVKTYGLAAEKESPPPPTPPPSEADRQILERPGRIAPRTGLLGGVLTFPWYAHSRKAWLVLSAGFLAVETCAFLLVFLYLRLFKDT